MFCGFYDINLISHERIPLSECDSVCQYHGECTVYDTFVSKKVILSSYAMIQSSVSPTNAQTQ